MRVTKEDRAPRLGTAVLVLVAILGGAKQAARAEPLVSVDLLSAAPPDVRAPIWNRCRAIDAPTSRSLAASAVATEPAEATGWLDHDAPAGAHLIGDNDTGHGEKETWWVYAGIIGAVVVGATIVYLNDSAEDVQRIELTYP